MVNSIGVFKDFDDNSIKSVFKTENNEVIEMTLIQNKEYEDVICVPTHHFCNLGCKMCHLTNNSLNKKMVPIRINDFIDSLIYSLRVQGTSNKRTNKNKLLISFMGVGEPLLNIELIKKVYKYESIIKDNLGYESIGYAISTMMPNDNLEELMEFVNENNIPLKVHFSLHSPVYALRKSLIPKTKLDVIECFELLSKFKSILSKNEVVMSKHRMHHTSDDLVEVHYTLIKDVNDSKTEYALLEELLKKYNTTIKFIRFNPKNDMYISDKESEWVKGLTNAGIKVKTYSPPGKGVGASCGEFTKHYYHEEIESQEELEEFNKWKKEHIIYESERKDNLSWDEYFMAVAKLTSMRSKDPNTQVGAVIVSEDNRILSIGYNGCPNGYQDERFPWKRIGPKLETKYLFVVHAERNAILNYLGNRKDFSNAKIYVDLFPCNECAKEIIQSGIKEVIYLSDKYSTSEETIASKNLFDICGVKYRQLSEEKEINLKLTI